MTNPITIVGGSSHSGTSDTGVPAHQPGDLILQGAYRSSAATVPTAASGFFSLLTVSGSTNAMRLSAKTALSTSGEGGTYTGATQVGTIILRGVWGLGGNETHAASSATVNWAAIARQDTSGNALFAGFLGHRTATNVDTTVPTGLTNRTGTSTTNFAGYTGAVSANWPSTNQTVNANSGYGDILAEFTSYSTFNPLDIGGNVTLSNGNRTALTTSDPDNDNGVRMTYPRLTGQYGFKITADNIGPWSFSFGLATLAADLTFTPGGNDNLGVTCVCDQAGNLSGFTSSAFMTGTGSSLLNLPLIANGDTYYILFDLDAGKAYVKGTAITDWNDDPTCDPDAGTGGFDFSGITGFGTTLLYPFFTAGGLNAQLTYDGTDISGAGVSSYSAWDLTVVPGQAAGLAGGNSTASGDSGLVQVFLTATGANSWTVPDDFSSSNTIEVIGGGAGGGSGDGFNLGAGAGGGGGGYSAIVNLSLTPGAAINYAIGAGGAGGTVSPSGGTGKTGSDGGDTWFNATTLAASSVAAKGGVGGSSNGNGVSTGGAGGASASGIGTLKNSGGAGGSAAGPYNSYFSPGGAGGGGAAGPGGGGAVGGSTTGISDVVSGSGGGAAVGGSSGGVPGTGNGAAGGNGPGGSGGGVGGAIGTPHGLAGGSGSAGTGAGGGGGGGFDNSSDNGGDGGTGAVYALWDSTHGPGAGGGGSGSGGTSDGTFGGGGGGGGGYGGGGGGAGFGNGLDGATPNARGGAGAQGIIVITYAPSSGGGSTLAASQGAFAETGKAALLTFGRRIAAGDWAFALTGETASLKAGRKLAGVPGPLALTGEAALLKVARKLGGGDGVFAWTGEAASLVFTSADFTLPAAQGTFSVNGQAVSLLMGRRLDAAERGFALTGEIAVLSYVGSARTLQAGAAGFALTGEGAGLDMGRRVLAANGGFALTGKAVVLTRARAVTAVAGSYGIAGEAAGLKAARRLLAPQIGVALALEVAALHRGRVPLTASASHFIWTGESAALLRSARILAGTGAFLLSGSEARLRFLGWTPGTGAIVFWDAQTLSSSAWGEVVTDLVSWSSDGVTAKTWALQASSSSTWN